ncbi:MAG: radical SAM protein [Candidatus Heimdallarchaeota archaeon]
MKQRDPIRRTHQSPEEELAPDVYPTLQELHDCKLCSWKCSVDRLANERGVCLLGLPEVTSFQLHPAPSASFTVFTVSCNFKCLNCQNWKIAHGYLRDPTQSLGWVAPRLIAKEGLRSIHSIWGKLIAADRLFFSGGSPAVALPWVEHMVWEAKQIDPSVKVNFDTNGFPTPESFKQILHLSDSITFDIKAASDLLHRELTGAPVEPVLRNAETMARYRDKLWEFRILVILGIIDQHEITNIVEFILSLDPSLPVCFLAFRPNFCLDLHLGATTKLMKQAVHLAKGLGLETVSWAGFTDISGTPIPPDLSLQAKYQRAEEQMAATYARRAGCWTTPRACGTCVRKLDCPLKNYVSLRST